MYCLYALINPLSPHVKCEVDTNDTFGFWDRKNYLGAALVTQTKYGPAISLCPDLPHAVDLDPHILGFYAVCTDFDNAMKAQYHLGGAKARSAPHRIDVTGHDRSEVMTLMGHIVEHEKARCENEQSPITFAGGKPMVTVDHQYDFMAQGGDGTLFIQESGQAMSHFIPIGDDREQLTKHSQRIPDRLYRLMPNADLGAQAKRLSMLCARSRELLGQCMSADDWPSHVVPPSHSTSLGTIAHEIEAIDRTSALSEVSTMSAGMDTLNDELAALCDRGAKLLKGDTEGTDEPPPKPVDIMSITRSFC